MPVVVLYNLNVYVYFFRKDINDNQIFLVILKRNKDDIILVSIL